jgi:hypothetical protein
LRRAFDAVPADLHARYPIAHFPPFYTDQAPAAAFFRRAAGNRPGCIAPPEPKGSRSMHIAGRARKRTARDEARRMSGGEPLDREGSATISARLFNNGKEVV